MTADATSTRGSAHSPDAAERRASPATATMAGWRSPSSRGARRRRPGRAAVTERLACPPPLLLIVVGVAASYVPGVPTIHLESEVVLLGLLPPLLYAAAIQTSLVDFNANRRADPAAVGGAGRASPPLAVGGGRARGCCPGSAGPPPSPSARWSRRRTRSPRPRSARRIGLPRRVVTILEGESLLNDATALVALRTAIAALSGGGRRAPRSASTSSSPPAAAWPIGVGVFVLVALAAQADHRPAAGHRDLVPHAVRGVRRGRGDRTPPASSRSSSPACCSATRRRSSRPRSRGSPSGSPGAPSRSSWRTPSSC